MEIHNSLHLALKYARIFVLGHICSSKLTISSSYVLGNCYSSEQIMSADKYSSIFPFQMEATVYTENKTNRFQSYGTL